MSRVFVCFSNIQPREIAPESFHPLSSALRYFIAVQLIVYSDAVQELCCLRGRRGGLTRCGAKLKESESSGGGIDEG